jgi:hypothetical protein
MNSIVTCDPWPLRISNRQERLHFSFVELSKTSLSQANPRSSLVHPESDEVMKTWCFSSHISSTHVSLIFSFFPSYMMPGGRVVPSAQIDASTVTHCLVPLLNKALEPFHGSFYGTDLVIQSFENVLLSADIGVDIMNNSQAIRSDWQNRLNWFRNPDGH